MASIKIPKLSQEGKKRKKKEHQAEKMEVGSDLKHKVGHTFDLNEFWVAERTRNKVWKRKYPHNKGDESSIHVTWEETRTFTDFVFLFVVCFVCR